MDGDDGAAVLAQAAQEIDDRALGDRVDALERLVHQVDVRVLDERPGEEHAAAARRRAG